MKNTKKAKGIYFFFLSVIMIFTTVNMMEFLRGSEEDGRRLGLGQMETVEDTAVTLWGGIQRLAGKRLAFGNTIYEDVTLLDENGVTMADPFPSVQAAVQGAEQARQLAMEVDAAFLYVQVPGKELSQTEFPEGVTDYSIQKYDTVISNLQSKNIPVLPMREIILEDAKKNGKDWMEYFYRTDHHWQNKAAFLAYREICKEMQKQGLPVEESLLQEDCYEKTIYEKVFLGTHGRMAGPLYTGLDDYELWIPKFETDYTLDIESRGIHEKGSFEECFVHYENLAHYSYDYYAYYAYLQEDYECIEITNRLCSDGARIVIIRDSEAVPVSVFLASQCSELDILDLRYMKDNYAADYIREKNPDMILYIFGTGYLGDEKAMMLW